MPTYGFRCELCAGERGVVASLAGPPPVTCACGAPMRRVFAPVGLIGVGNRAGRNAAAGSPDEAGQAPQGGDSCHDPSVVGGCLIRPELRAAWSAKNRQDGAAVDRTLAVLESKGIAAPF